MLRGGGKLAGSFPGVETNWVKKSREETALEPHSATGQRRELSASGAARSSPDDYEPDSWPAGALTDPDMAEGRESAWARCASAAA